MTDATNASRLGISLRDYLEHKASNRKWCWRCGCWHDRGEFGNDRSKPDGLTAYCRASVRKQVKIDRYVPTRDGDSRQAKARINRLVGRGHIPPANAWRCAFIDRDHGPCTRRAQGYHHCCGYADLAAHLTVSPMCTSHHRLVDRLQKQRQVSIDTLFVWVK